MKELADNADAAVGLRDDRRDNFDAIRALLIDGHAGTRPTRTARITRHHSNHQALVES